MGYYRAGFDVVGVDIKPQPRYPFTFYQADAMEFLMTEQLWTATTRLWLTDFDAIHASPPCQAFTQASAKHRGRGGLADERVDLLTPTRARLSRVRIPWVIENVVGAARHMQGVLLHGGMFGLGTHRARLFESNVLLLRTRTPRGPQGLGVYGKAPDGRTLNFASKQRAPRSLEEARAAMGIDWMEWDELKEAVPPAYTEFIGWQLIRACQDSGIVRVPLSNAMAQSEP